MQSLYNYCMNREVIANTACKPIISILTGKNSTYMYSEQCMLHDILIRPMYFSLPILTLPWISHGVGVIPRHLKEHKHRDVEASNGHVARSLKGHALVRVARDFLQTVPSKAGWPGRRQRVKVRVVFVASAVNSLIKFCLNFCLSWNITHLIDIQTWFAN